MASPKAHIASAGLLFSDITLCISVALGQGQLPRTRGDVAGRRLLLAGLDGLVLGRVLNLVAWWAVS